MPPLKLALEMISDDGQPRELREDAHKFDFPGKPAVSRAINAATPRAAWACAGSLGW
jgi:hypothetical protein